MRNLLPKGLGIFYPWIGLRQLIFRFSAGEYGI